MRKNFHMKKVVMLAVAMLLAAAPVALADQVIPIPDITDVRVWGTGPAQWNGNDWYDVIGDIGNQTTNGFNTSMILLTLSKPGTGGFYQDLKIQIYTNYITGVAGSVPADIVLSLGGTNNYGIAMSTHDSFTAGTLYSGAAFKSSFDQWAGGGLYGGEYAAAVNTHPLPGGNNDTHDFAETAYTFLKAGAALVAGNLSWAEVGTDAGRYLVTVTLPGYNAAQSADLNAISLFWGTGNCANDGIQGGGTGSPVPLPPSVLLLGSGLLGLALLGKRQIRKPE
jgi:opacity protein-like surface antigen